MSVTEPSDAVNAGMAKQNKGHRLAWNQKLSGWLVSWLGGWSHMHSEEWSLHQKWCPAV